MRFKHFIPLIGIGLTCYLLYGCQSSRIIKSYDVHMYNQESDINWDSVPKANVSIYKWATEKYHFRTYAQMVFIKDQKFVVYMRSFETDPLVDQPEEQPFDVYKDSCMEVFLKFTDNDNNQYFNAEINSKNRTCQQFGLPWYEQQSRTIITDEPQSFVTTANVKSDYWEITASITLDDICYWYNKNLQNPIISKQDFKPGFNFTGNFYKICGSQEREHYGMWNEIVNNDHSFHHPEQFGLFSIVE